MGLTWVVLRTWFVLYNQHIYPTGGSNASDGGGISSASPITHAVKKPSTNGTQTTTISPTVSTSASTSSYTPPSSTLMLHTLDHCSDDIILNLEIFTDIHPGEYIRVKDSSSNSNNSMGDNNSVPVSSGYVFRVPLEPAPQKTTSGRLEISINKSIAETMNFKTNYY